MSVFDPEAREQTAFELVPEGKHTGIINFCVDCGHHRDSFNGVETVKHLLFIGWELSDCLKKDGTPHWKGDFYTISDFIHGDFYKSGKNKGKPNPKAGQPGFTFAATSNFNKILRAWTGEEAERVKFPEFFEQLIASQYPCTVTIEHNEDKNVKGKFHSNIESIKPYKGNGTPRRVGPFTGRKFSTEDLDSLPGLIRNKIKKSIELTEEGAYVYPKVEDDDIPF